MSSRNCHSGTETTLLNRRPTKTMNTVNHAAHEPRYDWDDVQDDNAHLKQRMLETPELGDFLDSESYSEDDRILMHRLVRLSRFGYGLPKVRKPEYRNVHILP